MSPKAEVPKAIDLGVKTVGQAAVMKIKEAPTVRDGGRVGTLYSAGRKNVGVTLEPGRNLKAAAPERAGTYRGQIDVNASGPGGVSAVTLHAKDGVAVPLVVLLLGIGIGFVVEWWLTRWRPRSLLDRRLGRLIDRAERRRGRVNETLKRLFVDSRPSSMGDIGDDEAWQVPQTASTGRDEMRRFHLSRAASDLANSLQHARTDSERELFGPDGDALKALLTDEDTYAQLVGDLREAAHITHSAFRDLRDSGPIPIRNWFDYECGGWIIGDKQSLGARQESAKALRLAAERFAGYRRRLGHARNRATDGSPLANKLDAHVDLLDSTFRGDDDQVTWWDAALPALEAEPVVPPAADAAAVAAVGDDNRLSTAPKSLAVDPSPEEPGPAADVDPSPPWTAQDGVYRGKNFQVLEALIGAINLSIVAASGLAALYLTNSTFGSFADYVTLVLWGSTATAGLALLRRLIPGALKTSQPGVGG